MGHRSSKPIDLNIVNNYDIVLKVKLINFRKKFQQSSLRRLRQKVRQVFIKNIFWTLQDFKRLQLGARTKPIKGFLKKITHMTIGLRCKRSKARKSLASIQEGQTCRALAKNRIKVSFVALWKASFS